MNAIVERNKTLLRFYERAAQVVGWALLCGGIVWLLMFIFWVLAAADAAGDRQWPGLARNAGYAVSTFVLSFLVPGCVALLIAEFARYMLGAEGRPGLLLRHGDWILYACGVIVASETLVCLMGWGIAGARDPDQAGLLFAGPVLVPLLAKVLICIALGQVLGRVLPIIDESKTLV
jgi:hypothetical protein